MSNIKLGVSLYSYQDEYIRHKMTLEDCIRAVSDMGATGIEILPEEMIPDCFHLSDAFLDQWFGWMDKYGTVPVAADVFCDEKGLYRRQGREAAFEEALSLQKAYVDIAHKLGCKYVRCQIRDLKLLEALLPYAEDKNVKLGLEIHAPMNINDPALEEWYEIGEKKNSTCLGFIPDFGIFETRPTPVILEQIKRDGATFTFEKETAKMRDAGIPWNDLVKKLQEMGATPNDIDGSWRIYNVNYNDPELLKAIMPRVLGFHGKFWRMNEDMEEDSIDYANPMKIICESDFDGYINSEYEGGRHIQDVEEVFAVEQVRRHHAMMRNYIEKYTD